jgi:cyclopropane fatty-acyl-phospholipid synthase-like methyltransferase
MAQLSPWRSYFSGIGRAMVAACLESGISMIKSSTFAQTRYPRASRYDIKWVTQHRMGPNVLWLAEHLSKHMTFAPGMRMLDLGCGKAISSIFLAKEFGVQVWANDLWINATDNWSRICEAGLADRIHPVHAEAHALPYAEGFFDVIVSMDAYHYFGTDDLYIGEITRFLKPGGQIGIISPGLVREFSDGVPAHLTPYWVWEFCSFHSPDWWCAHWTKTGLVDVEHAGLQPDGWRLWLEWQELCTAAGVIDDESEADMLRTDAGRHLGFTCIVARKPEADAAIAGGAR